MSVESNLIPPEQARSISRRTFLSKLAPREFESQTQLPIETDGIELKANQPRKISRRTAVIMGARAAGIIALAPNPISQILGSISDEYSIPFKTLGPTERYRPVIANSREVLPPNIPPMTIAHRAGDSRLGIERAAKAGFAFAQLSISKPNNWGRYKDDLYTNHGETYEVFGAKVAVDITTNTITFNPQSLEQAFAVAKRNGIGLCIEVGKKDRGGVTERYFEKIHTCMKDNPKVSTMVYTTDAPESMGMAREILGTDTTYLDQIYGDQELDDYLKKPIHNGSFFTTTDIIHRHQEVIKARQLKPIVSDVNTPEEALMVLATGAAAGISGDAGLLQNLFCRQLSGQLSAFKA